MTTIYYKKGDVYGHLQCEEKDLLDKIKYLMEEVVVDWITTIF